MIVAFTGLLEDIHGNKRIAGAGKDEAAKVLVEHGFVSVAFADIMKRWCKELFGFTDEQLWGPSEERAKPDGRYRRAPRSPVATDRAMEDIRDITDQEVLAINDGTFLTVRYALQKLGDWGRDCYPDIWANKALEIAHKLLTGPWAYHHACGLIAAEDPQLREKLGVPTGSRVNAVGGVVIPDCRFQNEFRRVKEEGGYIIRVKRKCDEFPSKLDDSHISERDILAWDDDKFDAVIDNSRDLHYLKMQVDRALSCFSGRIIPYDDEQKDIPPFKRKKK